MSWRLDRGLDDTEPMARHIDTLILILGTREEELRELWVDYDLTIQCVGYDPASGHGAHLDREVVRQAARLGVAIDFDFYYVTDHEGAR